MTRRINPYSLRWLKVLGQARPVGEGKGQFVDRFLAQHQEAGATDSSGTFTLNQTRARSKLQTSQLTNPASFILKLVQAAVLVRAPEILLTFKREVLTLRFLAPDGSSLEAETVLGALDTLSLLPPSPTRHLAMGLNAALGTECDQLLWRTPGGCLRYQGTSLELSQGSGSSDYLFEMVRKRPFWHFHMAFADEYEIVTHRCQFSPVRMVIDGTELQRGLCTGEVRAPFKPSALSSSDFLYGAVKPGSGVRLASFSPDYVEWGNDPSLHHWTGKAKVPHSLLLRTDPNWLTGEAYLALYSQGLPGNQILPVLAGVTMEPLDDLLEYEGAALVVCVNGMSTDLSEFCLTRDERFDARLKDWNGWIKESLLSIPERALAKALRDNGFPPARAPYRACELCNWFRDPEEEEPEPSLPPAGEDTLGVCALPEEEILFSLPALRRFSLSVHFDCRAILTTHRVIFWDPVDSRYSWEMNWDEVAQAKIKDVYDSDLYFTLPGKAAAEMALVNTESRRAMREQLKLHLEPEPHSPNREDSSP